MKKLPRNHTFRGKRYKITTATKRAMGVNRGDCDSPSGPGKTIRVGNDLMQPSKDKELMEVLLHEGLHACMWDVSEEGIHQTADSLANLLWRCGYRRIME